MTYANTILAISYEGPGRQDWYTGGPRDQSPTETQTFGAGRPDVCSTLASKLARVLPARSVSEAELTPQAGDQAS